MSMGQEGRVPVGAGSDGTSAGSSGRARATSIVGLGMLAMNAFAYVFTLLCAHLLGPTDFGGVSALLGILIVANVGALALQATAARRLATASADHVPGVTRDVRRSGWVLAAGLGGILIAAVPVVDGLLHLDDWVATAMVGAACIPLTLMGAFAGIVQGERRWGALAMIYLTMGAGRVIAGVTALMIDQSLRAAMIGIALGSLAPAALGAWLCRVPPVTVEGHEPILGELWRNGHVLLAFFVFTNLDVLLARHLFNEHDAGIYAAGAILAKTCLFLPTFVLVVAFPTMATQRLGRPWLKPLLAVLGLGLLAVAGARVLPDLAVTFAGGSEYADLAHIAWLFALEGTLFASVQILVYDTIAGQSHSAFVLWLGAALVCLLAVALIESVSVLVALVTLVTLGVGLVTGVMPGTTHPD